MNYNTHMKTQKLGLKLRDMVDKEGTPDHVTLKKEKM